MPLNPSEIIAPPGAHLQVSLPRLLKRLHLGDCMTCAAPMTPSIKHSLVLQNLYDRLLASLHHPYCQDPAWLDEYNQTINTDSTYIFEWALLGDMPIAIVNPSLEAVFLKKNDKDIWVPKIFDQIDEPEVIKTLKIKFDPQGSIWNARISFTDEIGGVTEYQGKVTDDFRKCTQKRGKASLFVANLHHPKIPISKKRLWELAQAPDTLCTFVHTT